jgi:hypothetical protein
LGWSYSPDWNEEELLSGMYSGFVYLFQFDDGTIYIGSKQIYKRVKNYKKIRDDSKENDWRDYDSSSNIVHCKIAEGISYTKTILWCFPTMSETLLVESFLIMNTAMQSNSLNLAIMSKVRFPGGENKKRLRGIMQELLSIVS